MKKMKEVKETRKMEKPSETPSPPVIRAENLADLDWLRAYRLLKAGDLQGLREMEETELERLV